MYSFNKGDGALYVGGPTATFPGAGYNKYYGTVLDTGELGGLVHARFDVGDVSVRPEELEPDLRPYGYAPGGYGTKCSGCGETLTGVDKRATSCKPCALSAHAQALPPVTVSARYLEVVSDALGRLSGLATATAEEWEAMSEGERRVRAAVGHMVEPAAGIAERLLPEEIRRRREAARRLAFGEWVAAAGAKAGPQKKEARAGA